MAVRLSFNDVFTYLGDTGTYQMMLYFMVCLPSFFNGIQNMSANFFAAPMDHWCKVPRLENFSHEQQKYVAIPWEPDEPSVYQQCKMYDLDYDTLMDEEIWTWNRNGTNASLIDCTDWVYDQSEFISTINSKYDLVCDRGWMGELTSTIYMGGVLVGSVTSGLISDRFGRKVPMLLFLVGYFAFSLSQAFCPNYTSFVIIRFLNAACNVSAYLCAYVIVMEILGPKHYALLATCFHMFFSLGFMLVAGMAYSIRDHNKLFIAISLPIAAAIPFIWVVSESPRWLVSNERYRKAEKIIHHMAQVNRKDFPEEVDWIQSSEPDKDAPDKVEEKGTWGDICSSRIMCAELALIYLNWFTVSLVYYGVSFNAGAFGDVFMNTFLSGLIELPANFLCYICLDKIGRRWSNGGSLLVTGAFMMAMVPVLIINPDLSELLTALSTIGKGAITFAFSSIYLYTAELFPTPIRHLAMGSASMFARIGSMASPYLGSELEAVWLPMPSVIFGVIAILAGGLVFFLPETKGTKVPDTVAQAEAIGRARYKKKKKKKLATNANLVVVPEPEMTEKNGLNNAGFDVGYKFEQRSGVWSPEDMYVNVDESLTRL